MGHDFVDGIHRSQEARGVSEAGAQFAPTVHGDPALARLGAQSHGDPEIIDEGMMMSAEMREELLAELAELEAAQQSKRSPWTRPQVARALAVGGMFLGCAAGAYALGGAGLFLALAAEALAFAGGLLVSKSQREELEEANRKLRQQATTDPLTGLNNRGAIDEILREQLLRAPFRKASVSVIMADVDHFKRINDTYGHQVGDEVLIEVARRVKAGMRSEDSVGRYGGEELMLVLPGIVGAQAVLIAHRIRLSIAQEPFRTAAGDVPVTMSLGVSSTDFPDLVDPESLIRAADEALYRAKHEGRNRVVMALPSGM